MDDFRVGNILDCALARDGAHQRLSESGDVGAACDGPDKAARKPGSDMLT
jgi:hypothetical protein